MIEVSSAFPLVSRLIVGFVFLAAGLLKMRRPEAFRHAASHIRLVPPGARRLITAVLPAAEVTLGVLLVLGIQVEAAAGVAAVLTAVFAAVILFGIPAAESDCGCFGPLLAGQTRASGVARNAALGVIAAAPITIGPGYLSLGAGVGPVWSLLVTAATLALAFLLGRRLSAAPKNAGPLDREAAGSSRRSFLLRAGSIAAGGAVALLLAGITKVRLAEAACYSCGSCSDTIIWIGCTGGCCAAFWQRRNKYCNGACQSCSSWWIQEYCGYSQCC